jgi:hypothetical protein
MEYPSGDRRQHRRYPVDSQVEYKVVSGREVTEIGFGRVLNLSSGGILFESDCPLPAGVNVKLIIAWPSQASATRLKAHVSGYIVRSEGNCAAVRILHQVFRSNHTPGADHSE